MPNGHPDWTINELPKLEEFFSKIEEVLVSFAKRYNLMIDKYYHQSPSWDLIFRHPMGGIGQIEVNKYKDESVIVSPVWWLDDYETGKRFLKTPEGEQCSLDHAALHKILEDTLRLLVSWRKEDFKRSFEDPHRDSLQITKEEFDHELEQYPVPKLD